MQELCEFRVVEEFASLLFAPKEKGKQANNSVRKVTLNTDDPRFHRLGILHNNLVRTKNRSFFHGWDINYRYTTSEIEEAELFHLKITSVFEPEGQLEGTVYDENKACTLCGAGAPQVSDLFLPVGRIPKRKDISRTIAGEIVVSRRLADLFRDHQFTGVEFGPVRPNPRSERVSDDWFQVLVRSASAEVVAPTKTGVDPFDHDPKGEFRCPHCHLIGLNLLSEVSVARESHPGFDLIATRQFVGTRRGVLRPQRILLISPRLKHVLEAEKIKGYKIEIAYLV